MNQSQNQNILNCNYNRLPSSLSKSTRVVCTDRESDRRFLAFFFIYHKALPHSTMFAIVIVVLE